MTFRTTAFGNLSNPELEERPGALVEWVRGLLPDGPGEDVIEFMFALVGLLLIVWIFVRLARLRQSKSRDDEWGPMERERLARAAALRTQ